MENGLPTMKSLTTNFNTDDTFITVTLYSVLDFDNDLRVSGGMRMEFTLHCYKIERERMHANLD